jgi:O-antigen ligase
VVGRLRVGEVVAGVGAVVLLVALFGLRWYADPARNGWQAITTLRWFALVVGLLGLALVLAQAAMEGPALPVSLDLIGMLVAGLTTILLAIRLLTTGATLAAGAYVGVLAAAATALGAYRAMRTEWGWPPSPERPIELVELSGADPRADVH